MDRGDLRDHEDRANLSDPLGSNPCCRRTTAATFRAENDNEGDSISAIQVGFIVLIIRVNLLIQFCLDVFRNN